MFNHMEIVDVAPRDGLQNERTPVSAAPVSREEDPAGRIAAGVMVMDARIGVGGRPVAPAATGTLPTEDLVYVVPGTGFVWAARLFPPGAAAA